ncbi:MAG: 30S ribosomal protein S21 [Planctomycetota bacterium]
MAKVVVKSDEPIDQALRRFKKICDKEGIINRTKRKERFEKPAERRRREEMERLKTIRKAQNAAGDMATG